MREPSFWWRRAGAMSALLAPLAAAYGAIAARRLARDGRRAGVPVVCIGNLTVGGAGKTPLALALGQFLKAFGEEPVFLSRGYGGRLAGPLAVEATRHRAEDVGDEPLLLARVAPTIVARDRVEGANAAMALGASVVVMDDGFQNPSLQKDLSILVIDAGRGVGNGRVIPAGPLRAPIAAQIARADALVEIESLPRARGTSAASLVATTLAQARRRGIPVFHARIVPDVACLAALAPARVLAFAGIGNPGKFFATLAGAGIEVAATRRYADHHVYTKADAAVLCEQADRQGLLLVTTEKDLIRLRGDEAAAMLAARARALPITLAIDDEQTLMKLTLARLAAARGNASPG
jgi:tetraacyldisaccharide 4'-kinase